MDQQQQPGQAPKKNLPIIYVVQTLFKLAFLVMSIFNLQYTLLVAAAASIAGVLRVCKTPRFNKEYLAQVLLNNHGQNVLYIAIGSLGFTNYLYYAPIALFFAYGLVEFIKIALPQNGFNGLGDIIRNNRYYVYEGKSKIEIAFLAYCVITLPVDLIGRAIKVFIMAQFMLVKYRLSNEFRYACTSINATIEKVTQPIGFINSAYKKAAGWLYEYANRDPRGQQQQ